MNLRGIDERKIILIKLSMSVNIEPIGDAIKAMKLFIRGIETKKV